MIRNKLVYLLLNLACLSLAACGGIVLNEQQESALGQTKGEESSPVIVAESGVTATGGSTSETTPAVTEVAPPTAATKAAAVTEQGSETEGISEALETAAAESTSAPAHGHEADNNLIDPIYAQKLGETVALPACYDFDEGAGVFPPNPACDFSMLPGPEMGTIEIYPQEGAQIAYGAVFPEPPTLAECAGSDAFSSEGEIAVPTAAMYVCYQTGQGRTGYLHFTAADLEQDGTLTFDWVTFLSEAGDGIVETGGARFYGNDAFGFQLKLPAAWIGYQVTERVHAVGHLPDAGEICFTFSGHTPICVLKIDIWTKTGWAKQDWVPDGYYLGENESFVFAAGPYDEGCIQLDEFQCARRQEVPMILAGARFGTSQNDQLSEPPPDSAKGYELEAVLALPETVPTGQPVNLSFTLLNHVGYPLYVLKWYTPLEGLAGEIMHITRDGQKIPYQGIQAMRDDPEPENYVLLPPHGSVSGTVDLAQSYDFTEPGTYTVTFLSPRISDVTRTEAEMAPAVDDLGPVNIESKGTTVTVLPRQQ